MPKPFEYQRPTEAQVQEITTVREALRLAHLAILEHVPQTAERTLAIRHLQEAGMWANAAIVAGPGGFDLNSP